MKTTVAIETLGCKLNQAESEALALELAERGYCIVTDHESPDIYILNTCTVTSVADRKCRSLLRRVKARCPHAFVVATGCYSKRSPGRMAWPSAGVLIHDGREKLIDLLVSARPPGNRTRMGLVSTQRVRSFVKIQEGCNHRCTYCVVPSVRGPETSLDAAAVLEQVKVRLAQGHKEIVLTGTNIGRYRSGDLDLGGLVAGIISGTSAARIRLSSLQPYDITTGLLGLFREPRLCPHFHMPLQSGSPRVLRRMGRHYTVGEYRSAFEKVIAAVPDAAVTTDVIVGFPGETEDEHEESLSLCRSLGFAALHVFPYSKRPGTPAAGLGQVDTQTKKRRSLDFLALGREARRRFHDRFLGRTVDVLWEGRAEGTAGVWSGLTGNYIRVRVDYAGPLANVISPVLLERSCGGWVQGSVILTGRPLS